MKKQIRDRFEMLLRHAGWMSAFYDSVSYDEGEKIFRDSSIKEAIALEKLKNNGTYAVTKVADRMGIVNRVRTLRNWVKNSEPFDQKSRFKEITDGLVNISTADVICSTLIQQRTSKKGGGTSLSKKLLMSSVKDEIERNGGIFSKTEFERTLKNIVDDVESFSVHERNGRYFCYLEMIDLSPSKCRWGQEEQKNRYLQAAFEITSSDKGSTQLISLDVPKGEYKDAVEYIRTIVLNYLKHKNVDGNVEKESITVALGSIPKDLLSEELEKKVNSIHDFDEDKKETVDNLPE